MSLSLTENRNDDILAVGTHAGFDWIVMHNGMGFRTGYVKVPKGHPWCGKEWDNIDAEVHGGITFTETNEDECWVGFDAGHGFDLPDPDLVKDREPDSPVLQFISIFEKIGLLGSPKYAAVRTQAYMENECRSLCEQAMKAQGFLATLLMFIMYYL